MTAFVTTELGDTVGYDKRGSGPALVFVAGAGPFRAIDPTTTATAEAAAGQGITTIVYDRLGRGDSPAVGRLGLDRELAALRALIDVAGGSAVLCGHSSGCSISLAAAAQGLSVTGLVLFEAPMGEDPGEVRAWIGEVERRLDAGDLEGALEYYMKDMPPEWLEGARQDPMYPEFVAQVVSYRADGESLVWAEQRPYPENFASISVPVSCLVGEQSVPGIPEAAAAIAAAISGATSGTVPGANHEWEPAPMAAVLVEFVRAAAGAMSSSAGSPVRTA